MESGTFRMRAAKETEFVLFSPEADRDLKKSSNLPKDNKMPERESALLVLLYS